MLTIAGKRVPGEAGAYPVRNPARPEEVVGEAPAASPAQLDAAVEAARAAGHGWARTPLHERISLVERAVQAAEAAVSEDELDRLLTRENGKVLQEAVFDVGLARYVAETYAEIAPPALASDVVADDMGSTEVVREPWGVVGCIVPFNWPVSLAATKVIPALVAGNAVIVKPPPTCPSATLAVVAAMATVLPPGVLSSVSGPGVEIGRGLVEHPGVGMISFTGGVPTGRAVLAAAAARMAAVVLELGGNDPAILGPDVEVDEDLAGTLVANAFLTAGQVCMAIKRLYVPRERVGDVTDALVAECERAVLGDGLADEVTMGPLHTERGRDFVEGLLSEAELSGAKVHRCGRVRNEDASAGGYFVRPAIVTGATPDAGIVREEQFAPALPVLPYDDLDDAVAQANDTEYGLCASVWTGDEALAADLAPRLDAGTVFINNHGMFAVDIRVPFGGWKQSGIGRELGPDGLLAFTRTRSITNRTM